ncbi:putative aminoglycoside 6-adenylyltransferase [Paenibacillus sp. 598K]|nr:putative aminoglycoside 6-adenylyltransferase [Paenibacillus sp. 598K]
MYLMLLTDGNKIDLTLYPLADLDRYFADSDGLVEVLLDKDGRREREVASSDEAYWIKKPTARSFDDCCNEFWFVSTYVVKGLARGELLYAIDHLSEIARPNLLRMMSWRIGAERGYTFSVGKNYKFIDRYLPTADWELLLSTYVQGGDAEMRRALQTCYALFRKYSRETAELLGYPYPDYDEQVTRYTEEQLK